MGYVLDVHTDPPDSDGMYRVVLGSGAHVLPMDPNLSRLCLILYGVLCPVSPQDIYEYVMTGDHELDIMGDTLFTSMATRVQRSGEDDARPRSLQEVSQSVISFYWNFAPGATFGHPCDTFRFASSRLAALACAVNRVHNIGGVGDVWSLLSRSMHPPSLHWGILREHVLPCVMPTCHDLTDSDGVVSSSEWCRISSHCTPEACATDVSRLVVRHAFASMVILVAHHTWTILWSDPCRILHASRLWGLRFVPHALFGGHVELYRADSEDGFPSMDDVVLDEDDDVWPEWVVETCRILPRRPISSCWVQLPIKKIRPASVVTDVSAIDCDAKCRRVITHWSKSQRAPCAHAPYLLSIVELDAEDAVYRERDGSLVAQRCITDIRDCGAYDVFCERFGEPYTDGLCNRCGNDPLVGVYVVREGMDDALPPVAAYAVVLYKCVFHDGSTGVSVMIDSFAVSKSVSGTGVGGRTFFNLVCALGTRYASVKYMVFAQCVRTGEAHKFWYDKLDESSVARSLVLQALGMDGDRVPIHSEAQCGPRCREYTISF